MSIKSVGYILLAIASGAAFYFLGMIYYDEVYPVTVCIFFFVLSMAGTIVFLILAWLQRKLRRKILLLICQFLSLTFVFASFYYYLYLANPNYYNVSSDVVTGKLLNDYDSAFNDIRDLNLQLFLLSEMESNVTTTLKAIRSYKNDETFKYEINDQYSFYFRDESEAGPHGTIRRINLIFFDQRAAKIYVCKNKLDGYSPYVDELVEQEIPSGVLSDLEKMIGYLKSRQAKALTRLNKITYLDAKLSFLDFYYFSSITMTTTGYGDITPNDSKIRLIVIIQAITSVMFIAFGLTLLTRNDA